MTAGIRAGAVIAAGVAVTALVGGCASPGKPGAAPRPSVSYRASAQQLSALEDRRVSWDEYTASFEAFRQCFRDAGLDLADVRVDRDLYDFGAPEDPSQPDLFDRCYETYWSDIDTAWQNQHADDSSSAEALRQCLERHGQPVARSHEKNAKTMWDAGLTQACSASQADDE